MMTLIEELEFRAKRQLEMRKAADHEENELIEITRGLNEHPLHKGGKQYEGPCACRECRTSGDDC